MTFTTRAVVTQDKESDVIDVEKMKNLRVIMVREDGTIAYKEVNEINGSSVTVTFNTPVKTGGENFQFFAIANEDGILPAQNLGSIQSGDIEDLKNRVVGSGSEFTISNAIPQTKYWTAKVNPYESLSVSQQLDYLVSKISVQFKNETNKAQSLSNIHITGITPNGKGRLFNHPTGKYNDEREEIYDEVYVTTNDVALNNGIVFNGVTNLPSGESSAIQHYYTYPVDNGNISSPTLYAKWGDEVEPRKLELTGFTELKRNDHLKILITLTDVGIKVTYTIADWEENTTTIGGVNPTLGDSYMVKDWVQGDDVVIGEEPVEPEGPVTVEGLTISANPATIDLASATATTTLTINKPANITAITITPSGNTAFTGLSNPSSGSRTDNFKITGLSNNAGTVTVTLTANSNAATGSYTLTASGTGGDDYISNEATTTITLSKTQSGGGEISITYEYVEIEGWLTGVKISSQGANIAYPTMYTDEDGEKYAEETEANNNLLSPYFVPGWYNIDGPGHRSWNEAKKECSTLKSNTLSDWRLPTLGELQFLYDTKTDGIFNDYYTRKYWTIVPNVYFDMDTGTVGTYSDSTTNISITNRCITNYEE